MVELKKRENLGGGVGKSVWHKVEEACAWVTWQILVAKQWYLGYNKLDKLF